MRICQQAAVLGIGVEKDRAVPIEVYEHGECTIEHHPARSYGRDQTELRPVLKAEDTHYALDHHVHFAGCEKHAQLQLGMAKDACEQPTEAPEIPACQG